LRCVTPAPRRRLRVPPNVYTQALRLSAAWATAQVANSGGIRTLDVNLGKVMATFTTSSETTRYQQLLSPDAACRCVVSHWKWKVWWNILERSGKQLIEPSTHLKGSMIRNGTEYQEALKRLKAAQARHEMHAAELARMGLTLEEIKRATDPLRSFNLQLDEEAEAYERLERGDL
jgi:hypothetical protein